MSVDPVTTADHGLGQRLRTIATLGLGAVEARFDDFAAAMAAESGLSWSIVNLITDHQLFVGLHNPAGGLPHMDRAMGRYAGFCPEVLERGRSLVLPDVYAHPRFAGNEVVDGFGIRTYIGAPLIVDDVVIGTVCVLGQEPRDLSTAQQSLQMIKRRADEVIAMISSTAPSVTPLVADPYGLQAGHGA
ncbi:GAF domain-containing protein [Kitasatospora sp. NPDC094028]